MNISRFCRPAVLSIPVPNSGCGRPCSLQGSEGGQICADRPRSRATEPICVPTACAASSSGHVKPLCLSGKGPWDGTESQEALASSSTLLQDALLAIQGNAYTLWLRGPNNIFACHSPGPSELLYLPQHCEHPIRSQVSVALAPRMPWISSAHAQQIKYSQGSSGPRGVLPTAPLCQGLIS